MQNKIKLALVDDQALFRKGLVSMLNQYPHLEIIFEAKNGVELFQLLEKRESPSIILLDLRMPDMNGLQTLTRLKLEYPSVKIIIITVYDDTDIVEHLFEEGANAYLDKNASPEEVVRSIENVDQFDFHFNLAAQQAFREAEESNKRAPILHEKDKITKREKEVLELICLEYTSQEIAEKLFLSPRTVESYRERLLLKAGAKNIAGLVLFAIKNQFISTTSLKLGLF